MILNEYKINGLWDEFRSIEGYLVKIVSRRAVYFYEGTVGISKLSSVQMMYQYVFTMVE